MSGRSDDDQVFEFIKQVVRALFFLPIVGVVGAGRKLSAQAGSSRVCACCRFQFFARAGAAILEPPA